MTYRPPLEGRGPPVSIKKKITPKYARIAVKLTLLVECSLINILV